MKFFFVFTTAIFFLLTALSGKATEELAEKTGKSCEYCHLDPSGGGEMTESGKEFLLNTERKQKKGFQTPRRRTLNFVRFVAGYLHILTAIFWFGTILYVHIVLKPSYASRGLPRGEAKVGLFSMVVMAITGTILSLFRVPSLSILFETRFGILLIIKIVLFLTMVSSAIYVVVAVGPKLRKKREDKHFDQKRDLTIDDLMLFDGTEDQGAYVAYKGEIYNVTDSKFWEDGIHFGIHQAGADLTALLERAPHGEEKIYTMPRIGKLIPMKRNKVRHRYEKIFYFIAYMNLVIAFLIMLILALWRWW